VVFLVAPVVEANHMRHHTISDREATLAIKLVIFQVLATVATVDIFVLQTGGYLNREWFLTGGVLLTNGMLVDFGVITVIMQGWNVGVQIARRYAAPRALTQFECDKAYAVEVDGYLVDRLQMVSKYLVMSYMFSASMPLLFVIVLAMATVSRYLDQRNLILIFKAPHQSSEKAVMWVLTYIMPVAVLLHLINTRVVFADLFENLDPDEPSARSLFQNFFKGTLNATALVSALGTSLDSGLTKVEGMVKRVNTSRLDLGMGIDVGNGLGQPEDDALDMVRWSFNINVLIVLVFIVKEWVLKSKIPQKLHADELSNLSKLLEDGNRMLMQGGKVFVQSVGKGGELVKVGAEKLIGEELAGKANELASKTAKLVENAGKEIESELSSAMHVVVNTAANGDRATSGEGKVSARGQRELSEKDRKSLNDFVCQYKPPDIAAFVEKVHGLWLKEHPL